MKRNLFSFLSYFLLLIVALHSCKKEEVTPEDKAVSIKSYDFSVVSAANTSDEGYILNCVDRIVKLDVNGKVQWSKIYTDYLSEDLYNNIAEVFQTMEGGYILTYINWEFYSPTNAYKGFINVIRTDPIGDLIWKRSFSVSKNMDEPLGIYDFNISNTLQRSLGEYIFISSFSEKSGLNKYIIIKLDANGNLTFKRILDFPFNDINDEGLIKKAIQTSDNGYLITGFNRSIFAAKLDASFNKQWDNVYNITLTDPLANNVIEISANNFAISGYADVENSTLSNYEYFMIQIDNNGAQQLFKTFGTGKQDYCFTSSETSDGNIVFLGAKRILTDYTKEVNMYFVKTNMSGDVLWENIYGQNYGMEGVHVKQNTDNTFTLIGYKIGYENSAVGQTIYIRTKSDGSTY